MSRLSRFGGGSCLCPFQRSLQSTSVSEFKVEKAVYGTKKGIPKDAVFHKRAATTIWSTEAVAQCSSSSKCSGGDSGRYWATQLESSCCQGNARFSTFSEKMHATMQGASA
ncbi:uncharacterized protein LOC144113697 [Amblyomma americanum]